MRTLITLLLLANVAVAAATGAAAWPATVELDVAPGKISIPVAALVMRDGIPGVFVVDNVAVRFRMVRTGKRINSKIEIVSGLFGNETVVTANTVNLFDGKRLPQMLSEK